MRHFKKMMIVSKEQQNKQEKDPTLKSQLTPPKQC